MDKHARQRDTERASISMGIEKYRAEIARNAWDKPKRDGTPNLRANEKLLEDSRDTDDPASRRVVHKLIERCRAQTNALAIEARKRLIAGMTTGQRLGGWEEKVLVLNPLDTAYIGLKCCLIASVREHQRVQKVATTVGRVVMLEARFREVWKQAPSVLRDEYGGDWEGTKWATDDKLTPQDRVRIMKHELDRVSPRSVKKWLTKLEDILVEQWSKRDMFVVGAPILDAVIKGIPEYIEKVTVHSKKITKRSTMSVVYIAATPLLIDELQDSRSRHEILQPVLLPMIVRPEPWANRPGVGVSGGYLNRTEVGGEESYRYGIIKGTRHQHTENDAVSPTVWAALNRVQDTRWKINTRVLGLASEAVNTNKGVTPYEAMLDMPTNVSAAAWAKMTTKERGVIKNVRESVHTHNNRQNSRRMSALRVLTVAGRFADEEEIFFPHNIDWRGRAYPLPQDLHPQADDFAKVRRGEAAW
jgi:DNA-directed RNA polymerase